MVCIWANFCLQKACIFGHKLEEQTSSDSSMTHKQIPPLPEMDAKFEFAIDRGGTFTDVFCRCPDYSIQTLKLLSEDPANYQDAPTEGIRRILQEKTGKCYPKGEPIDASVIGAIRMGTTVATNALLERKGEPIALVITKGFKDLLHIGNQSRPNLFDLSVTLPEALYQEVIEVEERVYAEQKGCCLGLDSHPLISQPGHSFRVVQPLNLEKLEKDLKIIYDKGIRALAVVLMHSYAFTEHEQEISKLATKMGFTQVSLSSEVMPMVKIVSRGYTVSVDAYLTPAIKRYLINFQSGFKNLDKGTKVMFMQSDGGLAPMQSFTGSRAILSGPAGGVIGYAFSLFNGLPLIGFDMGGTSTDVSRYAGSLEHVFETSTAGVTIQAPQLDINTVAAGGGSRLFFRSGLFSVGPESAGAHPGPACYSKGGPLAITDANLALNRLLPNYFPKIFGANCDEPLSRDRSIKAFEELQKQVNLEVAPKVMSIEEIAMGFIRVANEAMCRPIRALTQGKGYDTSKHALACFGGAGGQHACAIARSLGIQTIIIHRFAGILSAYGMALADVVSDIQEPCNLPFSSEIYPNLKTEIQKLISTASEKIAKEGFSEKSIEIEIFLHLRYDKTDCALMIPAYEGSRKMGEVLLTDELLNSFNVSFPEKYNLEFGFTLQNRDFIVDDIRVRALGKSSASELPAVPKPMKSQPVQQSNCYFEEGSIPTDVYLIEDLEPDKVLSGPVIIIDKLNTILVEPGCTCFLNPKGHVVINVPQKKVEVSGTDLDFAQLSIFSHRFMSIAEQMGKVLQKTAISTNIKERLDFSCAMFGPDGGLVANAPHIPVHLGAMQETVRYQMKALEGDLYNGDVILTNHPMCGGSHLPDFTVITPVFDDDPSQEKPVFFVASRGHHADIGGVTPGSMPPFSTQLAEEGAVFKTFKLVDRGLFQEENTIKLLEAPANKVPGSSGSRNIRDNLADLKAQIAANNRGIRLIKDLIREYTLPVVQAYMQHIRQNAEVAVRNMLKDLKTRLNSDELQCVDKLDNGAKIEVRIRINDDGGAVVNFQGTSPELCGNQCAPRAVCMSALIYCLRCLVPYDIPLNQGCLQPIKVDIPSRCLLDPGENTAVVGGNVTTSQRLVDVVLKAFQACADSQGCMNNLTFGNKSFGYYETIAGGSGAGPGWHGRSGVHTHMTNTRITDPEILEKYYPVILDRFSLRDDNSGGQGLYNGGEGVIRELTFRQDVTVSLLTERRVLEPRGLLGGENGKCGENIIFKKNGSQLYLGPKVSTNVAPGEKLMLKTPGGGGYGSMTNQINSVPAVKKKPVTLAGGSVQQYKLIQESA